MTPSNSKHLLNMRESRNLNMRAVTRDLVRYVDRAQIYDGNPLRAGVHGVWDGARRLGDLPWSILERRTFIHHYDRSIENLLLEEG